jgi:YidC/Oxa1 family membrane protein insertase
MFTDLIVQPLFNLLVFIYALLPGHNFGLALVLFTIIIRLLLWPLVKKQLHQAKAMRKLQPELKRIKQATKGNRQKESQMLMELYKERGINPFGTFPILIVQLIVLIGLYSGLNRLIHDPNAIISFSYPWIQDLSWMQALAHNIHLFDNTLLGAVDLGRAALDKSGVYWPAMLIVIGSAVAQYFQAKQLMPTEKNQRSLRTILKSAGQGQQADQSEVNAAVMRGTRYLIPVMIFVFTVNIASALSLYWLVSGLVAFIQQSIVLNRDETEMEALADGKTTKNVSDIPEAEIVETKPDKTSAKANAAKKAAKAKKRRKRK